MSSTIPISETQTASAEGATGTHRSAMRTRFGWFVEKIADHLFFSVVMNEAAVRKIRALSEAGTVVYTLRHRSFVDYFLVNYVLRREGLPLPVFANGISATPLAPLRQILHRLRLRVRELIIPRERASDPESHDFCAHALRDGRPVLVFMRGRRRAGVFGRWLRRPGQSRVGSDYLRELVHVHRLAGREHFIVPMALFRGHSVHRRETPLSALIYSVQDVPSDARKLAAYWWNRRALFITVGKEVALAEFMERYGEDTEDRLVRRLTRAIQIFLSREERVVQGPALLNRRQVRSFVMRSEEMQDELETLSRSSGVPLAKLRKEADGYFNEMAADFNGILFGLVAYVFKKIWGRMFTGITPIGFDEVVEKVRHNPIVLVPCHRSHLDYLIMTYLFHLNFVSPPHIAAGINMAFWPMGPFLRASGAYFIRRSFADNEVYKTVFNHYLKFLIREGYTQEFFIEGGRSRTGKILTPKLGMLSAIINAYLSGIRRDLYLCPVSIHYGRIVEEDAYEYELSGGEKEAESFGALLRARRFLQKNYGTVYMSFAEPISLKELLGEDRQRYTEGAGAEEIEEEKRRFIQRLGFKILRDVNDCSVAGATSISATVLLGAPHAGTRYEDYAAQANALSQYVIAAGVRLTASLERNLGSFRESLGFLSQSGHIDTLKRGDDEILIVSETRRLSLDFYKNNLIHVFLIPSLVAASVLSGRRGADLVDDVWWWLEMYRFEFALPARTELPDSVEKATEYLQKTGALSADGELDSSHALVRALSPILDCFRQAYWLSLQTIYESVGEEAITEKTLTDEFRKNVKTAQLLGEVTKPECGNVVLLKNALSRSRELGLVEIESGGRGGRDKLITRGPNFGVTAAFIDRIRHPEKPAPTIVPVPRKPLEDPP
jgi:glycerol-3-phosphate O-acyltransferase